jgi:hypothetical protein
MKSLKERQADRAKRAKENGASETPGKLIYGDGQPIANGGFGLGSNGDGLNENDANETNPPGSGESPNQGGKSIADEARSFAGLGPSGGNNGGGSAGGSGEGGEKTVDKMTVAELDDYITKRGGTPTGDKAAKVEQAKALPAEIGGGWQA